jgi:lipoate-protein ligase B
VACQKEDAVFLQVLGVQICVDLILCFEDDYFGMRVRLTIQRFGVLRYERALGLMANRERVVRAKRNQGFLLVMSHPPTITIGRLACASDVLVPRLYRLGAQVSLFYVDRGGGATYHYPGQAVVYPVLDLENAQIGVRPFIRVICDAVIDTMKMIGIDGWFDEKRPGVYVGREKIASVGLAIKGMVSSHGVAINCSRKGIEFFKMIVPCKDRSLEVSCIEDYASKFLEPLWFGHEVAKKLRERLCG